MIERNPNVTSFIVTHREGSTEKMRQVAEFAQQLGGIAITQVTGINGEWFGLSPAEMERQRRLDMDTSALLSNLETRPRHQGHLNTVCSRLFLNGVDSVRDLLVVGFAGSMYSPFRRCTPRATARSLSDATV
jgi:hypothetical protein